jgi:phosphoribosylanthranilate isomerase
MPSPTSISCKVKVCGIRDAAEAAALDAMGVDWLGFNFHPGSARYISPEDAAPIIAGLKRSVAVGVFVDAGADRIREVAATTGIRMAQLHGSEDWSAIREAGAAGGAGLRIIKAVPHTALADLGGLRAGWPAGGVSPAPLEYLLVDTQVKAPATGLEAGAAETAAGAGVFGGSGQAFDWTLLERHALPLPCFLAGGLGPHNLAEAVRACKPFAVDLNSKVETAPGRKDLAKVEACLGILSAAARPLP